MRRIIERRVGKSLERQGLQMTLDASSTGWKAGRAEVQVVQQVCSRYTAEYF